MSKRYLAQTIVMFKHPVTGDVGGIEIKSSIHDDLVAAQKHVNAWKDRRKDLPESAYQCDVIVAPIEDGGKEIIALNLALCDGFDKAMRLAEELGFLQFSRDNLANA